MENRIINTPNQGVTEIMKNTTINMSLTEWSAAAVLITVCLSGVAIYGIKTYADITVKKIA